jgi:hypothetical protein
MSTVLVVDKHVDVAESEREVQRAATVKTCRGKA